MHVYPDNALLQYSGRIDFDDPKAPVFVYPGSYLKFRFFGSSAKLVFKNHRWDLNNYLGVIVDGKQDVILLPSDDNEHTVVLASGLKENIHEITIFKRMDGVHYITILGIILSENAGLLAVDKKPDKRIEVYGDSVSAGEIVEAQRYVGKLDPEHFGEYSNSYFSYATVLSRLLKAELHNISQGGIALLDNTGYFLEPQQIGIENTYNLIQYNRELGSSKQWDFSKYVPHVVIVAIGQNDSHPDDYMAADFDSEESKNWRIHYENFIRNLRNVHPNALIICMTTIMNHDSSWDRSIGNICKKINDDKICHFEFSLNGAGTPGHPRKSECEKMAWELYDFIEGFGSEIWKND